MNETDITILIVEDDPITQRLIASLMDGQGYQVCRAENGQHALQLLASEKIDAIASDVQMPEMDGYELCKAIRENPATENIPFVFISGLTDLDEMMRGYKLGADEYLKKPIDPNEVTIKINRIIENKIQHTNLNQQLSDSRQAAMQAMSYSSHLGQVLQFMQNSLECMEYAELAGAVFNSLQSMGLIASLQIHTHDGMENYSAIGQVSPLEANIIEMARKKGRFFDFEKRTFINHDEFSLLIKNMPLDNPEQYGIFKDVLGNLCTALEARIKFLLSQSLSTRRNNIIVDVEAALSEIDSTFKEVQKENLSAIDNLREDIEEAFLSIGLTESQEDHLRAIIKTCQDRTNQAFEKGINLVSKFEAIHDILTREAN